jgi:hypothetical protein
MRNIFLMILVLSVLGCDVSLPNSQGGSDQYSYQREDFLYGYKHFMRNALGATLNGQDYLVYNIVPINAESFGVVVPSLGSLSQMPNRYDVQYDNCMFVMKLYSEDANQRIYRLVPGLINCERPPAYPYTADMQIIQNMRYPQQFTIDVVVNISGQGPRREYLIALY